MHGIQPPRVTREKGDVTLEKNRGKLLSKKEINQMVDVADARETAIIYIMQMPISLPTLSKVKRKNG